jgi:hypothetical protein
VTVVEDVQGGVRKQQSHDLHVDQRDDRVVVAGEDQRLPVWSRHVGDPILESNMTRRVDFALFMVEALTNDELVDEAPAIVGRRTPSALAHAGGQ